MSEILGNPIVQTILGVSTIVATIVVYLFQRKRKSLVYEIVSIIPLSTVPQTTLLSFKQVGLQFTFNGEPIPQAFFVVVKIANNGDVPIRKEDFEVPFSLNFSKDTKVLACREIWKKTDALQLVLKVEPARIVINPLLLNSKESFGLETLVSNFDGQVDKINAGGHIAGAKIQYGGTGLTTREEELITEMSALDIILFMVAIVTAGYFVGVVLIFLALVNGLRLLKLRSTRKTEQSVLIQ